MFSLDLTDEEFGQWCGFCNYYDGSNWEQYTFVIYNQYFLLYGEIDDKAPGVFFLSLYSNSLL